jgi:hypothetical protein
MRCNVRLSIDERRLCAMFSSIKDVALFQLCVNDGPRRLRASYEREIVNIPLVFKLENQ